LIKTDLETIPLQEKRFSLKQLVSEIVDLHKPAARSKNLEFRVNYASDVPTYVLSDQHRLHRILLNTISNAIKFTENGYVALDVSLIKAKQGRATISFAITDTGVGMQPETYQIIFIPFNKLNLAYTGKYSGSGLGLPIVKKFMSELGGEIEVDSKPGKGTVFNCIVPCKLSLLDDNEDTSTVDTVVTQKCESRGLNFLVVEDDPIAQRMAAVIIEDSGNSADIASCGLEALTMVEAKSYAAVIMDVGLPDLDGIAVSERIRAKQIDIPIFALTAQVEEERLDECLQIGINSVISKPLDPQKLAAIVSSLEKMDTDLA